MVTNVGTQIKFNISLTLPGNLSMDEIKFYVEFYVYSYRALKVEKAEMERIDENNYVAVCDSAVTGPGEIKMRTTALIPNGDTERKEIETVSTKVITV